MTTVKTNDCDRQTEDANSRTMLHAPTSGQYDLLSLICWRCQEITGGSASAQSRRVVAATRRQRATRVSFCARLLVRLTRSLSICAVEAHKLRFTGSCRRQPVCARRTARHDVGARARRNAARVRPAAPTRRSLSCSTEIFAIDSASSSSTTAAATSVASTAFAVWHVVIVVGVDIDVVVGVVGAGAIDGRAGDVYRCAQCTRRNAVDGGGGARIVGDDGIPAYARRARRRQRRRLRRRCCTTACAAATSSACGCCSAPTASHKTRGANGGPPPGAGDQARLWRRRGAVARRQRERAGGRARRFAL